MCNNKTTFWSISKNLVSLMGTEVTTRITNLILFIYLSRVLQLNSFGLIGLVSTIIAYSIYLINFGYDTYGIRQISQGKESPSVVYKEITSIKIISSVVAYAVLVVFAFFYNDFQRSLLLFLYSLTLLYHIFSPLWIFISLERMHLNFNFKIVENLSLLLFTVVLFEIFQSIYVIPISLFISQILSLIFSFHKLDYVKIKGLFNVSKDVLWKTFLNSSLIGFSSILALIYLNSDLIILDMYKSEEIVGIYNVVIKIFMLGLIPYNVIFTVFYPRISSDYSKYGFYKTKNYIYYWIINILYAVITSVLFILYSKEILENLFGSKFTDGQRALQVLSISILFAGFRTAFGNIVICFNKEKILLFAILIGTAVNIVLNFIFIPDFSYLGAAYTTLISEILVTSISIILYIRIHKFSKRV